MRTIRTLITVLVLGLLATACGEAGPLEHVGEASARWVTAVTVSTTEPVAAVVDPGEDGLIPAADVLWANDDVGNTPEGTDPRIAISAAWQRHIGSRFIQSSRTEISAALPTIRFPGKLPADVKWVTSQLVFDPATGLLDPDTSAAFGLWTVEPYTSESGRIGVLRVGAARDDIGAVRSDIVPIIVPDGLSLGWTEGGLRYELFCRVSVSEEMCNTIAESFIPLADLLPGSGGGTAG
jgi:hypothetical protein